MKTFAKYSLASKIAVETMLIVALLVVGFASFVVAVRPGVGDESKSGFCFCAAALSFGFLFPGVRRK